MGLDVTAYIPGLKPRTWMLHPFRVQRVLGDGTYPRVEPVAQMWDPVGVLGDGGMTYLIPGLKPGAEMYDPGGVPKIPRATSAIAA